MLGFQEQLRNMPVANPAAIQGRMQVEQQLRRAEMMARHYSQAGARTTELLALVTEAVPSVFRGLELQPRVVTLITSNIRELLEPTDVRIKVCALFVGAYVGY
jgi:hypothetical protein